MWNDNNMQGYGVYTYNDGNVYEGMFNDDKKEGYGKYHWKDGRRYEGWWHRGRQHGLGIFEQPDKKSMKFGLWENGRRVKWFDQEEVELIR